MKTEPFELTSLFALGGFALLAVGGLVSLALVRADAVTTPAAGPP